MIDASIEVRDVSVRYGEVEAIRSLSFQVSSGSFVAVIGPNGAGKSSLIHVLLGLQRPNTGSIRLFGQPVSELPAMAVGFVPQVKTLDRSFPALAIELVATGLLGHWPWRVSAHHRQQSLAAMNRTGVENLANRQLATLSGGELQRVYLARCLVRKPRLVVLDEPGAGLDVTGEADMYHLLLDYQRESGATVLMVTHDWEGARYHATHVLLLNRRMIGFGPADEFASEERLLQVFGFAGHGAATHGDRQNA